jgi:hypothetical protein
MIQLEHLTNGAVRVTLEDERTFLFNNEYEAIEFILGG